MTDSPLPTPEEGNNTDSFSFRQIFEAQAGLVLLLSPQFTIRAATDSYLRETMTTRDIINRNMFDVFPENPDLPEVRSLSTLKHSLQQVLASRKTHKIEVIQYDIPNPQLENQFLERFWSVTNTPLLDREGAVVGILHEAINVSENVKANLRLERSKKREQEALAQANQQRLRLERLLEQAPAAFAMLEGPDLVFKVLNKAYQQLFPGRPLMGLPVFEALPELRHQPIYDIMYNVYRTGETFEGKEILVPMSRYEGQPIENIYWSFIYQALYDAKGNITGVLIFCLDVTEFVEGQRQVERSTETLQALNRELEQRVELRTQELQEARAEAELQSERLRSLFMQAPAAICILSGPELVFELVNPSYAQLFPGRQLMGKPILEALPEIKDNQAYRTFLEVYSTGVPHREAELLIPFIHPESGLSENRYFRYVQQARFNEQGKVDGVIVFALEVTEQVVARKAVEVSEKQLRLVTDALPVLISYLDKSEHYRFANKAYEAWFNLKVENVLYKHISEVIGEQAYKSAKGYINRVLAGERLEYELAMAFPEGMRHVRVSYVPDTHQGEVAGFYALITDVTPQVMARTALERSEQEAQGLAAELATANESFRQANQELSTANKLLTLINTDLDNFIYTASHDLKAPIANIEGLLALLSDKATLSSLKEEESQQIMAMMQNSVDRFKRTIDSLTDVVKLQHENAAEAVLVNVTEVIEEASLDLAYSMRSSGVQLEVNVDEGQTIRFSRKNLRSIIYNLLSNSIKYSSPGRVPVVRVYCQRNEQHSVLTVKDNGLGIAAGRTDEIFTMFKRLHDHVEGTGIGLYMVRKMVYNVGGHIEVESLEGEGSTFRIFFPNHLS